MKFRPSLEHLRRIFSIRLRRVSSPSYTRRPIPTPLRIVGGLGSLIIIGTAVLMLPGMAAEGRLAWNEALFTATSALSVTGLSIIVPSQDLSLLGQIVLLLLIQIGGIGFMLAAVVVFLILGRKVSLMDRLALSDSLGLIMPGAILKLTRRVIMTVLMLEAIGAALLWLHWRGELGNQQAILYAIFHAVSAFCNAGFDLFGGLPEFTERLPNDNITLTIMGTLIFVGGLGIPVLSDILSWQQIKRFSLHTRLTMVVVVTLIFAGGLGMFLAERGSNGILEGVMWPRQLLLSFFQSISARTAGFTGIHPFSEITPASQLLLMALMFVGAAPASMGGGITTGTFAVLGLSLWGYASGRPKAHIGGRSISTTSVQRAAAVLTISLFVVMFCAWLIMITHDAAFNLVLFEVISAFATCGLSLGLTDDLNLFGQMIIVFVMFWGRLGALTIVVALAGQAKASPLVSYPEEPILIG